MNEIYKKTLFWNMTGSMLMAFQSVILLMVITRVLGVAEAGIYTLAYASANLLLTIGKYGVRIYQVSDTKTICRFGDYFIQRIFTTLIMLIVAAIYIFYASNSLQYSNDKIWIIVWMSLYKAIDSMEDVFVGAYQQKGFLNIGAKSLTIRLIATIFIYCSLIIVLKDQLQALIITTLLSAFMLMYFIHVNRKKIQLDKIYFDIKATKILFMDCWPLFLSSFLVLYISNAPKFAIDSVLGDVVQAYFGYIAMPIFVVGLLNGFIFNPVIKTLSKLWEEKRYQEFDKIIIKQHLIVLLISAVCVIGAYLLGVPVLSRLYSADLSDYKNELIILLFGGGLLGAVGISTTVLTIMRFQNFIMKVYIVVSGIAFMFTKEIVIRWGILGASISYILYMLILEILLFYGYKKQLILKQKNK